VITRNLERRIRADTGHSRDLRRRPAIRPFADIPPEFYTETHRTLEQQPAMRILELRKNAFAGL
jgi:hypothetical protein